MSLQPPLLADEPGLAPVVHRGAFAALLAVTSGVLYFLGFAGFDVWPLAFIALVPLLLALRGRSGRSAFALGWLMGAVTNAGGFYWIVSMLRSFSSFSMAICVAIASLFYVAHGLSFGALAWLVHRGDRAGVPRVLSVPASVVAIELCAPSLFPSYFANSLHAQTHLIQIADLGGVLLVSAVLAVTSAAIDEAHARSLGGEEHAWRRLALPAALWLVSFGYGVVRVQQIDREDLTAPALRVAVVQLNLGLSEKRDQPWEALERHLVATRALEHSAHPPDLVVWSESAVGLVLPRAMPDIREYVDTWDVHVPVLFGALSARGDDIYNTAMMVDASGRLVGLYDKVYLLAFGEYMPGGHMFPKLYELSPRTGQFTPGTTFTAMPLPRGLGSVLPLICYEDVLPRFVRTFQRHSDASLFAVILNDAWFGDTAEPWIHFALSKFRSIELRRDFVRAANAGVSGFVDAAGRVIAHTGTFREAVQTATVHVRSGRTLYERTGDWIGWAGVAVCVGMVWRGRKRKDE